jgi:cobalt-zinc-cadmium efflux system outer membrane protein
MKNIFIILILAGINISSLAQNSIDYIIEQIEKNNTTLAAYRLSTQADKTGNKTGILPDNPSVGLNFLKGDPSSLGKRTDFSISQSFEFPTVYMYQNQIANLKNEQSDLNYQNQRNSIVLQTRIVLAELTYLHALRAEFAVRNQNNVQIAKTIDKMMKLGETSIITHNRAQANLLNSQKELEQIDIRINENKMQLTALNGGIELEFSNYIFNNSEIPTDFEKWYALAIENNPNIQWISQELDISEKEQSLQLAKSLPNFSAGYMTETTPGEKFQGVSFGMSIPLWQNNNTIKYAKLKRKAVESLESDAKLQFYNQMKILFQKITILKASIDDFKEKMSDNHHIYLLEKALAKGEISLSDYYYELMIFYDNKAKLLEMEKELNISISQLKIYEN